MLVTDGTGRDAIEIVRGKVLEAAPLLRVRVTDVDPGVVGTPLISPVLGLIESPPGRVVAEKVVGELVPVIW